MTSTTRPLKTYFVIFGILLALTALTTVAARIDLGRLNLVVALSIAVVKASLVALFFMHLTQTRHRTQFVAGAAIFWLLILITFTLSDGLTRNWIPQPRGW